MNKKEKEQLIEFLSNSISDDLKKVASLTKEIEQLDLELNN